jgi:hypothetical protein
MKTAGALIMVALLATACTDTVSDEAIEDVEQRCEEVSQATLDLIATGITEPNPVLSHGAAVKSTYGPQLWIIGAQFNADGFEDDRFIGIWAVVEGKEAEQITGIAAVDDFTRGISTWGDDLGQEISSLIDGVSAAGACVQIKMDAAAG